ncbi:hypothetical protein PV797_16555 [Clostridiaceae bacterium M8S5]|nr:hypothetical protein PV797_16555 [Clostridiaceae bacterium M8S5]
MKIKKTIITSAVALTLTLTPFTSIYASSNFNTGKEVYSKEFKKDLSQDTIDKAKTLLEKMIKREKQGNYDDAQKIMKQLTELGVFDEGVKVETTGDKGSKQKGKVETKYEYNFDNFAKELKKDLSQETINKAKVLFEKMIKLEREGNYDDAQKIMKQLIELNVFDEGAKVETTGDKNSKQDNKDIKQEGKVETKYEGNTDEYTFDLIAKEFRKDLSQETRNKAKVLFEKMIKLEREGNYDDAQKIMKQLIELGVFDEGTKVETTGDKNSKQDNKDLKQEGKVETRYEGNTDEYTFDLIAKEFKKDLSQETRNKAKVLFERMIKDEKEGNYDNAQKIMKQLIELNIFDEGAKVETTGDKDSKQDNKDIKQEGKVETRYEGNTDEYTFDLIAKEFRKNLSQETRNKAKVLFERMIKDEKEGNYDNAQKIMKQLIELNVFDEGAKVETTGDKNSKQDNKDIKQEGKVETRYEGNTDEYTFDLIAKEFRKNLSQETRNKAKVLFEKMIKLEREGNYDDAQKIMKQLIELGVFNEGTKVETTGDKNSKQDNKDIKQEGKVETRYEGNTDEYTFDLIAKEFKKDLSQETINKAKVLFEKMIKLEREGNYDDAQKIMKQLIELGVFDEGAKVETTGDKDLKQEGKDLKGKVETRYEGNTDEYTFDLIAKEFRKNLSQETRNKAKVLFERMIKHEKEGNYDDAAKCMKQLIELGVFNEGAKVETTGGNNY